LVYVGTGVAEGQTIIILPPSATKKTAKRAQQVVRIEEDEG
jgi:hypothetical protein